MARWEVDARNASLSFIDIESPRFALQLEYDGAPVSLTWLRLADPASDSSLQFVGVDADRRVEIRRTYERNERFSFTHRFAVQNIGEGRLNDVRVALDLGGNLPINEPRDDSVAAYIYEFQRSALHDGDGWRDIAVPDGSKARRFAFMARHRVLLIDAGEPFSVSELMQGHVEFELGTLDSGETKGSDQVFSALPAEASILGDADAAELMFSSLWTPLAALCLWVEKAIIGLADLTASFAVAMVLFAVAVRLATLPVTLWSVQAQKRFNAIQAKIKPQIAQIKIAYKGAEQSERILSVYRDNGVSPLSGLKGSLGLLIQLPILIAVFNVTTESSVFSGAAFLWIADLSRSDGLVSLGVSIPTLGAWFNVLPVLLGVMNVLVMRRQQADSTDRTLVVAGVVSVLIVFFFWWNVIG